MTEHRDWGDGLLLRAQQGFEAEDRVEPGDDLLIARMAKRAPRPQAPEKRSRLRYFAQGALAGALATGLAMAGAAELRSRLRSAESHELEARANATQALPKSAPARTPDAQRPSEQSEPAAAVPAPAAGQSSEPAPAEPGGVQVAPRAKESPVAALPGSAPQGVKPMPGPDAPAQQAFADAPAAAQGASELFRSANQARVQGDVARAIATYRQLEATFPQSAEAGAAHLSLGVLYLQAQQPAAALAEVRRRQHGGGALEAEALWTEAQALRQLGRSVEERGTLQQLVKAYPGSAYVTAATRRLAELR